MAATKDIPTFDELQKGYEKERTRNNRFAYIGLNVFGGLSIILAVTTKGFVSDVLSDFLVNIAAGFFSAAILFALIQRIFFDRELETERTNALIRESHQYGLMRDQAIASGQKVTELIEQCKRLIERLHAKRQEARLMYLNRVAVILKRALDQHGIAKGYADAAFRLIHHLWDEYFVELKKIAPDTVDGIHMHVEVISLLKVRLEDQEEFIKELIELNSETMEKVKKNIEGE